MQNNDCLLSASLWSRSLVLTYSVVVDSTWYLICFTVPPTWAPHPSLVRLPEALPQFFHCTHSTHTSQGCAKKDMSQCR